MRKYAELADVNIVMGAVDLGMEPAVADLPATAAPVARKEAPWGQTANELQADIWMLRRQLAEQQNAVAVQGELLIALTARVAALEQRTWWSMFWSMVRGWFR